MITVSSLPASTSLYRTIWRWHFYAGLLVLPFLVMMAITGGAYLFKPELDHWVYRVLEDVPPRAAPFAPAGRIIARVEATLNGRVIELTPSTARTRAVRLLVRGPSGAALTVFADPYDGRVTGSTPYGG
ncbi:MAG: PepSY domain-containing protein, partial [Steroidobacteraceae bacterium]